MHVLQGGTVNRQAPTSSRGRQTGLSLVELMISLVIGLFLLGAVSLVYLSTSTGTKTTTQQSRMNEDAALALEILQQQIRLAGFSTQDPADSFKRRFTGISVRGCDGGFTDAGDAFDSLACSTEPSAGTDPDALVIRYEATALNSQVTAANLPGNCAFAGISAVGGITVADNRYFIDQETDPDDASITWNSLYCQGSEGAAMGDATPLIPNIDDFQVQFGITAMPVAGTPLPHQVLAYVNPDGTDSEGNTVVSTLDAARIAAVRICVLARSTDPVPANGLDTATVSRYVDCNGDTVTTNTDRHLRRAYVTTIQLRNLRPGVSSRYTTVDGTADGTAKDPWTNLMTVTP